MLMLIISSFGPIHNCFFWFRVWLLQKAGQLADGKAAHKEHQQQAVRRQTAHRDHLRRQGAEDALLPCGKSSQNSPTESGRRSSRPTSRGRRVISGGQSARTCSRTESPCTLRAAQQSRLPHGPVRAARSQPEQTSSSMAHTVPTAGGNTAPTPAASIRKKSTKPQSFRYAMVACVRRSVSCGGGASGGGAVHVAGCSAPESRFSSAAVRYPALPAPETAGCQALCCGAASAPPSGPRTTARNRRRRAGAHPPGAG